MYMLFTLVVEPLQRKLSGAQHSTHQVQDSSFHNNENINLLQNKNEFVQTDSIATNNNISPQTNNIDVSKKQRRE